MSKRKQGPAEGVFESISPLTREAKIELFAHLCHNPPLLKIACEQSPSLSFGEHESEFAVVWTALTELAQQTQSARPISKRAMRAECEQTLREGFGEAADWTKMFGAGNLPKDAPREVRDEDLFEPEDPVSSGLLEQIYAIGAEELDERRGQELLKAALNEELLHQVRRTLGETQQFSAAELATYLDAQRTQFAGISTLFDSGAVSVERMWEEHDRWMEQYRGRQRLGLATGMAELDRRTCGLRGLGILGAGPGSGKTALSLQMGLGVCAQHRANNAVVVFISLEMDRKTILSRVKCNLADIDFDTLMRGSPGYGGEHGLPPERRRGGRRRQRSHLERWFEPGDRESLASAERRMRAEQIGRRLLVLDRRDLGREVSVSRIASIVQRFKETAGASRVLVVVDYLQVMAVPADVESRGDLAADRYRVEMLQDLLDRIKTDENSDCVLAISEARKPSNSRDEYAKELQELMGTARIGYAADFALLLTRMSEEDLRRYYGLRDSDNPERVRRHLSDDGQTPMTLTLRKGRDGMDRGDWGVQFAFRRMRFQEIVPRLREPSIPGETAPQAVTADGQAASRNGEHENNRPAPRPRRRGRANSGGRG